MVDEAKHRGRPITSRRRRAASDDTATPDWSRPDLPHVDIYTDGGAIGNPGPGGWAAILRTGEAEKELTGGYRRTTNNRMEITAAIRGLEALTRPARVTIHTDSQYLANAINLGWARQWKAQGWMRNRTEPALNPDLWERLLALLEQHEVRFQWVRGHAGHPENERADRLAVESAKRPGLPADETYEGR